MESFIEEIKEVLFSNITTKWFLVFVLVLFALLRIPSLVEPNWYGDEGIYQVVGKAIFSGEVLYKDIWDNKPPLLYFIYAIFNGELFYVKVLSLILGLLSVITFFLISAKLFKKEISRYVSTFIFAFLFATPIIEGNIANAENFMLFPVTLAAFLVLDFSKNKNLSILIIAGLLLSIALITKIVAVFDFLAFIIFLAILDYDDLKIIWRSFDIKKLKSYMVFLFSFLSLLILVSLYFLLINAFPDFLRAVFSGNVSYVNVGNDYVFPLGVLLLKTVVLFISLLVLFHYRKNLSKAEVFIFVWAIFSIYNAFFSHRPYTHYILVMLPVFSLIVGKVIEDTKKLTINLIFLSFMVFASYYHFTIYKKTLSYYANYYKFMTGSKNFHQYSSFFDGQTPRDYEIAEFINSNTADTEKVFLWSNSAQVYALSDKQPIVKYAVAYHITFYEGAVEETIDEIRNKRPVFIIQTAPEQMPGGILTDYRLRYELDGAKIYEREI